MSMMDNYIMVDMTYTNGLHDEWNDVDKAQTGWVGRQVCITGGRLQATGTVIGQAMSRWSVCMFTGP